MSHAGLGGRLRTYRLRARLSAQAVADAMQIDVKTLYRWERDEFEPSVGDLVALASLYGVTVNDFVYEPVKLAG